MTRKMVWIGATVFAVGILGAGAGVAAAETGVVSRVTGGGDVPLTGDVLQKVVDAARAVVGEGVVTDSEADGDGDSAYEVEILKPDGQQVEVNLDSAFKVIGSEVDDDASEGGGAEGD